MVERKARQRTADTAKTINVSPAFHTWAQTISIIVSTGIAVFALIFGIQAQSDLQASAREENLEALWSTYNESIQKFYESRMDGGEQFERDILSINLFQNSLMILDAIDARSDDSKWERRIGFETLRHHPFICKMPGSEGVFISIHTGRFLQRILNKRRSCSNGEPTIVPPT